MNNSIWAILTVDLENMNTPLAEGKYNQNLFSTEVVKPLIQILDQYGIKAVFFASVFEYCRWDKKTIGEVLQYIDSKNHDIQLHTHPFWCYGRHHMWQYSLDDQIQILKHGRELFKEFLNRYPIAHRAGAYGLNNDTIEALRQNSIFIDSSMFHRHLNCKQTWSRNRVIKHNDIIEIPVTGFYRDYYFDLKFIRARYRRKFIKTDFDWCSVGELLDFIEYAKQNNTRVINLFMHSYSVLKPDRSYRHFLSNDLFKKKLNRFLERCCRDKALRFITLQEFWDLYKNDPKLFSGSDHVPVLRRH